MSEQDLSDSAVKCSTEKELCISSCAAKPKRLLLGVFDSKQTFKVTAEENSYELSNCLQINTFS